MPNIQQMINATPIWSAFDKALDTHNNDPQIFDTNLFVDCYFAEASDSLNKIKELLFNNNEEIDPNLLIDFLSNRWALIKGSSISYTAMPNRCMTEMCVEIARVLHEANHEISIYQYLMPSITRTKESLAMYPEAIDELPLDAVIMTDDMDGLIPAELLANMTPNSITVEMLHKPYTNEEFSQQQSMLSLDEQQRLISHNDLNKQYFQLTKEIHQAKSQGSSLGHELYRLIQALNKGGVQQNGLEFDAGVEANIGLQRFFSYWNHLNEEIRNQCSQLKANEDSRTLGHILAILKQEDQTALSCVEVNADALDKLLVEHTELYQIGTDKLEFFINEMEAEYQTLKKNIEKKVQGQDNLPLTINVIQTILSEADFKLGAFSFYIEKIYIPTYFNKAEKKTGYGSIFSPPPMYN